MKDVIEILSDMIRIDSRNTMPLDAEGERVATEEAMGAYVERLMRELGMEVEKQYIAPGRPNVIGYFSCGISDAPTIGLNAHLDTVGTDGMKIPPFEPVIKDGLIYGRGSCDTKGSLAAMAKASEAIISSKLPVNVLFVATASEETGCQGSPFLKLDKWKCDGFIVGEPTSNQPVVFHKSHGTFELICRGKAAHGSRPELGDNAICKAARLVTYLETVAVPKVSQMTSPNFINGCTLSPNMISGGTKGNIVPDYCKITCDMRLVPEAGDAYEQFRKIAEEATAALGFPVELGWTHAAPSMGTPKEHPFVQAVCSAAESFGIDATPQSVAYCTDGGNLSKKGFPCVVLGPGDIKMAHGAIEFSPVKEIRQAVDIYTSVARKLLDQR